MNRQAVVFSTESGKPSYGAPLAACDNVRIAVPKKGPYMKIVEAHTAESVDGPFPVERHWRHGLVIGKDSEARNVIVYRHYFGFSDYDHGLTFRASVEIIPKTNAWGQSILVNIRKRNDVPPEEPIFEMRHVEGGVTPIPGTNVGISFVPAKERKPKE
jgi:hypothetical protein